MPDSSPPSYYLVFYTSQLAAELFAVPTGSIYREVAPTTAGVARSTISDGTGRNSGRQRACSVAGRFGL
jgi:hypothetical protein